MAKTFDRNIIIRAARHFNIVVNHHILGRKEIHQNILRDFALSALNDPEEVKNFINFVKALSRGQKKLH